MLFWYSKSYFDIRTESENSYFDIQNPILTFELSRKMLFWYSKSYFDIRTESKMLFWYWKSYLTFELSRKILFWHSKSYFDIRTESENSILIFKILFWHSNWVGKSYFNIVIFWHSKVRKCDLTFELSRKMLFWYLTFYFDIRTESENRMLIFKILFWHWNWVGKSYLDIQNPILTFELSLKKLFLY